MGNRANIQFVEENGGTMYFYSHWGGFETMKKAVKTALMKHERWDDDAYLARIIFCQLVKDDIDGTTGIGLSTEMCDNENPVIEVHADSQTVVIKDKTWTFGEFIV